ncbi:MAG: D-aminoacylase [Gemmatimonadetes bacterium]|nr:D-aminoacylase [Gemmatimonadota bacterium]
MNSRAKASLLLPFFAAFCAAPPGPGGEENSFLVTDVTLVDGTGAPARLASVRVEDGRITEIGDLEAGSGEVVVPGRGRVLAPGFVDTHSHHDAGLTETPDALAAVSQGITTVVVGQDGGSQIPLADFFEGLAETPAAVNVASFVGHGALRRQVMAEDFRRPATDAEVEAMSALLRREMRAGALGLSTGLEYDPGIYSTTDEVVALARVAAEQGGRYISHVRSEDRDLVSALDEAVAIGEAASIPVQISHMKLAMRGLWGRADEFLARLDRARARGVEVTADVYPYEYWQSTMTVLFPDRDFTDREAAEFALDELVAPEGMLIGRFDAEPGLEGLTLAEIARDRGTDPVTTYLDLIAQAQAHRGETGDSRESIVATSMDGQDIGRLLAWDHTNVSSDGALDGAHPRGFGAYPRVLGRYVRDQGVLSLEVAIRKMTSLAAAHVGLTGVGVIEPGAAADLVLFDPARVLDRATPSAPHQVAVGIERVWVGGALVYSESDGTTGARPGRVLKRRPGVRF